MDFVLPGYKSIMPQTRTTSLLWGSHLKALFCTAAEIAAAWCNPAANALSMQTKKIISLTATAADAVWGHRIQVKPLLVFFLLLIKDGKNENSLSNFYPHLCMSNDIPFQ